MKKQEEGVLGGQSAGWNQYPRPQMKREEYIMLNDGWKLNGKPIRVPFSPQSVLSEYDAFVGGTLVYEKDFFIPESFTKERILLHFGAVDQVVQIWVKLRLILRCVS